MRAIILVALCHADWLISETESVSAKSFINKGLEANNFIVKRAKYNARRAGIYYFYNG
ncbi:hypothetical protein BN136_596 [Cronobacter universalis NCTC 9529]|nr:hypothetical protein BN136_596 [Cronobacter universalis NCTC 9529]